MTNKVTGPLSDWEYEHRWSDSILEGGLVRQDTGILGATPKVGKTREMFSLATGVAGSHVGEQYWLGYRCVPYIDAEDLTREGRKVIFLDLENPADESRARKRSALAARGLAEEDVKGNLFVLNLRDTEASWSLKALLDHLEKFFDTHPSLSGRVDIIVIDPVYLLIDGDENSNSSMARFFSEIGSLRGKYESAIFFTHHFTKPPWHGKFHADRIAGAGTFSRYPEFICTLTPTSRGLLELNATTRRMDCHDVAGRLFRAEGATLIECDAPTDISEAVDPIEAQTRAAFDELATAGPVRVSDLAAKLGKDRSSLYGRLPKFGFSITKGVVTLPVVAVETNKATDNNPAAV